VFDTGARNRAGRKSVAFDDHGILRQHGLDVQRLEFAAIKRVEISEAAVGPAREAVTEIVLTAGIEAQLPAHLRPPRFEKAD
jgi:hypothetical protein